MQIQSLRIKNFRNLAEQKLVFNPKLNLFFGKNGSGKTSLLEAIYHFGYARSFRTHTPSKIIQYESEEFSLFCEALNEVGVHYACGMLRTKKGELNLRLNHEILSSSAALVELFPMQLLNPDSYELLTAGPKTRRQFLDWGLFHVKPIFINLWRRLQKALKQRNAALKQNLSQQMVSIWDPEIILVAEELNQLRKDYVKQVQPYLSSYLGEMLPGIVIDIKFYSGWNEELGLETLLKNNFNRDKEQGYTEYGPHKADLKLTINKIPAVDVLSRGQQKLFAYVLKIAQAAYLKQATGENTLILIDDLPSELDSEKQGKILELILEQNFQLFITAIEPSAVFDKVSAYEPHEFHVEQGKINFL